MHLNVCTEKYVFKMIVITTDIHPGRNVLALYGICNSFDIRIGVPTTVFTSFHYVENIVDN